MVYVEFLDTVSGAVPAGRLAGLVPVRYEAPPDPEGLGRTAVGYLKPSGEIDWVNKGTGEIYYKSDQKWVYNLSEAAALEKDMPDRFVRVKG